MQVSLVACGFVRKAAFQGLTRPWQKVLEVEGGVEALRVSLGSQTLWGGGQKRPLLLKGVGFVVGKEGAVRPEEELGPPAAGPHLMAKTEPSISVVNCCSCKLRHHVTRIDFTTVFTSESLQLVMEPHGG